MPRYTAENTGPYWSLPSILQRRGRLEGAFPEQDWGGSKVQDWYKESGATEFLPGGQYAPENILQMDPHAQAPQMGAPSVAGMQRYGLGAMDLASRAAGAQTGAAYSQLGGLNPAARATALAQITQAGAGAVGGAGVQGYMQGGSMLQGMGQANLGAQMQNIAGRRGLMGAALGQTGATARHLPQLQLGQEQMMRNYSLQMQQMQMQRRQADEANQAALMGGFGNLVGNVISMGAGGGMPSPQMMGGAPAGGGFQFAPATGPQVSNLPALPAYGQGGQMALQPNPYYQNQYNWGYQDPNQRRW